MLTHFTLLNLFICVCMYSNFNMAFFHGVAVCYTIKNSAQRSSPCLSNPVEQDAKWAQHVVQLSSLLSSLYSTLYSTLFSTLYSTLYSFLLYSLLFSTLLSTLFYSSLLSKRWQQSPSIGVPGHIFKPWCRICKLMNYIYYYYLTSQTTSLMHPRSIWE